MNHISFDVEFLGGTSINNAVEEAKELAKKLDVAYICFDFNETRMSIGKNADVDKVVRQFLDHIDFICEA